MGANKFLLVKGIAGLGNRIMFLLSALLYARLSGRRTLVDWCDGQYAGYGCNAFPLLFESTSVDSLADLPEHGSVEPPLWQGRLQHSAREMWRTDVHSRTWSPEEGWRTYTFDLSRLDQPEDILVGWSFYQQVDPIRPLLTGPYAVWRRRSSMWILRQIMQQDLLPHSEVADRAQHIRQASFQPKMIGVHLRYTDRKSNPKAFHRRLSSLLETDAQSGVFLATDSLEVEREFRSRYPNVVTAAKWLPDANVPMHRQDDCPDPLEMARSAVLDMCLLGACQQLIVDTRSSFSCVASLMSAADERDIYDLNPARLVPPRLRHALWLAGVRASYKWKKWNGPQ
ncbi:MAG: hypothetical protein V2I48_08510 [Xanthomonadales bacterium]|jgi:hypothetical protein|nr:hypothetical protein [Xanthomonadales bacterium]